MTKFKIIVMSLFALFIIGGVFAFATFRNSTTDDKLPEVTVWGTFGRDVIDRFLSSEPVKAQGFLIRYVERPEATLHQDFVEAIATGAAPDLIILPHDLLYTEANKIVILPFEYYPERQFKDTFIDGAELFLTRSGVLGIPFAIDPLVMYWNRSDFRNAGLTLPPKNWDEFFTLTPKMNKSDSLGNITKSVVSLGEYTNVAHAKEILSTLIFQAGGGVTQGREGEGLVSVLTNQGGGPLIPAEASLRFYNEFSDSAKPTYSWSKALPRSTDAFVGERLSTYFGFASEVGTIRGRNPNLNFDVARIPQARGAPSQYSFARVYGIVIPSASLNFQAAYATALLLSSPISGQEFSSVSNLPPVRRDLLSQSPTDAFRSVFYDSAIIGRGWIDPSPSQTSLVFKKMIEDSNSGKEQVNGAVSRAEQEISAIIKSSQR